MARQQEMQVQEWNQEWLQTLTAETPSSLRLP